MAEVFGDEGVIEREAHECNNFPDGNSYSEASLFIRLSKHEIYLFSPVRKCNLNFPLGNLRLDPCKVL